jgi:hypothetical protein
MRADGHDPLARAEWIARCRVLYQTELLGLDGRGVGP